jgi:Sulfotransferase family
MSELKPILMTSPTIRCGTTLLQRLLCSSSNALIYGEEIGKDLELQLQIFASRKMVYTHSRQRFASSLDRVMQGDANDWIPDLMPDIDGYLEALRHGSFAGLSYCQQYAKDHGREFWGFKYPGWQPHLIRMLFDAMPGSSVIYIFRDLADCIRSAKAWGELHGEADTQQFCAQWAAHMKFMQQWQHSQPVLMLKYEELIKEPVLAIERLSHFLPFQDIKSDVLLHKINNMTEGTDTRREHNDYIDPAALTAVESGFIEAAMRAVE